MSLKLIIKNNCAVLAIVIFIGLTIVVWMFSESVKSLDEKVDILSETSEEQKVILEKTIKDYQADRAQFKGIFESVADRLDVLDRNLTDLENIIANAERN